MGTLSYGVRERRICFDDRTLAHIKSVIVTKLPTGVLHPTLGFRRRESG